MRQMSGHSGQVDANMELESFSKDFLIKLLKLYSRLYLALDGFWYLSVKERSGNEQALACDLWVWEIMSRYELSKVTELLGIQGNNVSTFIKAIRFTPWFWNMKYEVEVNNENDAILTVSHCPTLEALEKEGEGREESICRDVDTIMFQNYAQFFNPDMQAIPLKLPPRKSREEICCQWQFKVR